MLISRNDSTSGGEGVWRATGGLNKPCGFYATSVSCCGIVDQLRVEAAACR